ncbi:hypothetical protein E2L05_12800, partial [Meridianimarinicoccus aquatilis]
MTDARDLTQSLGGRWHSSYGTAPCPVCQPERRKDQNALTLHDGQGGQLLAHCKRLGCAFADVLASAGITSGDYAPPDPVAVARREAERLAVATNSRKHAYRLWTEAQPIRCTVGEI